MRRVACIVEGQGETEALPVLLRRVQGWLPNLVVPHVGSGDMLRVPRSRLVREGELERATEFAARRVGSEGAVLILVDADDDLPCILGPRLLERARRARSDIRLGVVLANREYEAWFLAAARSLRGRCGLRDDLEDHAAPETVRDAKSWLSHRMRGKRYRPSVEQAKLTAGIDLDAAMSAPSFAKLVREIGQLLAEPTA